MKPYNEKRMTYKGKIVRFKTNPRKGFCLKCGKKGITNLHHYGEYVDSDPTRNTMELCRKCHTYETWRLGQYNTERYKARIILFNPITKKFAGSRSGSIKL